MARTARRAPGTSPPPDTASRIAGYRSGDVTIATEAWFLAAARTIDGPPMSISSTSSSNVIPGRSAAAANG